MNRKFAVVAILALAFPPAMFVVAYAAPHDPPGGGPPPTHTPQATFTPRVLPTQAQKPTDAPTDEPQAPPEKVLVCKYVGQPGVNETLQTGQNPIEVSVNSIPDWPITGYFADQQGRSYVLSEGETCPDGLVFTPTPTEEPTDEPTNTSEPTATEVPTEEPTATLVATETPVEASPTPQSTEEQEPTATPTGAVPTIAPTRAKVCNVTEVGALFELLGPNGQHGWLGSYQRNPWTNRWAIPNVAAQNKCLGWTAVGIGRVRLISRDCTGHWNIVTVSCTGGAPCAGAYGKD